MKKDSSEELAGDDEPFRGFSRDSGLRWKDYKKKAMPNC